LGLGLGKGCETKGRGLRFGDWYWWAKSEGFGYVELESIEVGVWVLAKLPSASVPFNLFVLLVSTIILYIRATGTLILYLQFIKWMVR